MAKVPPTTRISAAVLLLGALAGCSTSGTAHREVTGPRSRPAGIAVDPATHVPHRTAKEPWIGLEQPAPRAGVLEVLDDFFAAVTREDTAALSALFTSDAEAIVARGSKSRALEHWSRRLERLDYTTQRASLIYSPLEVDIREAKPSDDANPKSHALLLRPGEWMVRVPTSPALGNSKLFGKLLEVVLSETTGGYKIRVLREDFELPDAPR